MRPLLSLTRKKSSNNLIGCSAMVRPVVVTLESGKWSGVAANLTDWSADTYVYTQSQGYTYITLDFGRPVKINRVKIRCKHANADVSFNLYQLIAEQWVYLTSVIMPQQQILDKFSGPFTAITNRYFRLRCQQESEGDQADIYNVELQLA